MKSTEDSGGMSDGNSKNILCEFGAIIMNSVLMTEWWTRHTPFFYGGYLSITSNNSVFKKANPEP